MSGALAMLKRCRELREQSAQRAQVHASFYAQQARADEDQRRRAAVVEAQRQFDEQNDMLQSLLRHDVLPQTMGALLERHRQRRDMHEQRIDEAVQRCHHMDQHLEYARRQCIERTRALERAVQLVEDAAVQAQAQAESALESTEEDFVSTWIRRRQRTAVA